MRSLRWQPPLICARCVLVVGGIPALGKEASSSRSLAAVWWSPHSVALAHARQGPLRCASSPMLDCSAQAEAPLRRASSLLIIGSLVKPFSCFLLAQQQRPGGALPAPRLLLCSSVVVWRSRPSVLLVLLEAALLWHFLCEKKRVDRRGSEELIDKG
jgi:hypothetical protein